MTPFKKTEALYVWFDTEYSTLDLEEACLLQVAALITNTRLERVLPQDRDIRLVIRLAESQQVSQWVEENLKELLKGCRSNQAVDIGKADELLSRYVSDALKTLPGDTKERPILAGNSIQMDWRLMQRFLPKFGSLMHYRLLDVTALKLQWQRCNRRQQLDKENPDELRIYFPEASLADLASHDAYYDVQASIAELAFYRRHLFR